MWGLYGALLLSYLPKQKPNMAKHDWTRSHLDNFEQLRCICVNIHTDKNIMPEVFAYFL